MITPISSPNFPILLSNALDGMTRGVGLVGSASQQISGGDADPGSVVDLVVGQRLYEMNAKVLKTADEMLGTLLDVVA